MTQYRSYPVFIVYSRNTQENAHNTAASFYIAGDKKMHDWMKDTGMSLMEIVEDSAPAYQEEAAIWKAVITRQLDQIVTTVVGQRLLSLLNLGVKIWILPDPNLFWAATTSHPRAAKQGGGIRIHFNPEQWPGTADDTLVHELAHAMRMGNGVFDSRRIETKDWPNLEEFLATQVANVYRSSLLKRELYDSYHHQQGRLASKGTIYSEFVENPQLIQATKYCLDNDALAQQLSRLPVSYPEFNPFRDYPVLERMALGKLQTPGHSAGQFLRL